MMSDMFMRNVLNILECAEYVLRVITENDDLELTEVVVQKDYKNYREDRLYFWTVCRNSFPLHIRLTPWNKDSPGGWRCQFLVWKQESCSADSAADAAHRRRHFLFWLHSAKVSFTEVELITLRHILSIWLI